MDFLDFPRYKYKLGNRSRFDTQNLDRRVRAYRDLWAGATVVALKKYIKPVKTSDIKNQNDFPYSFDFCLTRSLETATERITSESWLAATNRTMIQNTTISSETTWCRTRIDALLIFADASWRTVRAGNTLGSTSRWTSLVSRRTGTNGLSV